MSGATESGWISPRCAFPVLGLVGQQHSGGGRWQVAGGREGEPPCFLGEFSSI